MKKKILDCKNKNQMNNKEKTLEQLRKREKREKHIENGSKKNVLMIPLFSSLHNCAPVNLPTEKILPIFLEMSLHL